MRMRKDEIVPGLLVRSTRFSDVLILAVPSHRGRMVQCEVFARDGTPFVTLLPWQSLHWT